MSDNLNGKNAVFRPWQDELKMACDHLANFVGGKDEDFAISCVFDNAIEQCYEGDLVQGAAFMMAIARYRNPRLVSVERAQFEAVAKTIYEQWSHLPGYVPWVIGGNSDKQDEARALARKALTEM